MFRSFFFISILLFISFSACTLNLIRNFPNHTVETTPGEVPKKLGLIVIYESDPSFPLEESPGKVREEIQSWISENPSYKLLELHISPSFTSISGEIKNTVLVRIRKFSNHTNWSFYLSAFTMFILPGSESLSQEIEITFYDSEGNPNLVKTTFPLEKQTWRSLFLFPFSNLSDRRSLTFSSIQSALLQIRNLKNLSSEISGEPTANCTLKPSSPLLSGISTIRINILKTYLEDRFEFWLRKTSYVVHRATDFHPEATFLVTRVEIENPSDSNAIINPKYFLVDSDFNPTNKEEDKFKGKTTQFPIPVFVRDWFYYPKTFFALRDPSLPFLLKPGEKTVRELLFVVPENQTPKEIKYPLPSPEKKIFLNVPF
ncbi:hypothetical protein LEP1GSC050_0057 [Leptospira phage vB_LbrZ_5399-LE1]|uniref:Lipoprotein n=1 Tax=Leptospira inadai serovar Lyme TaxID=293084 RepID=A0ABX4YGD7_9LEPT|nr:hypothetical protein LEP1GSC050_0057 [Leptospira phage vB_LbrZ_5399-LE1]AGS80798.1 hypothetical protein LEP1GSC047_0912 [Leptospira phage vB_LinZ_10-LE1]PNV74320.1 hypothetical protein BES34_014130 [Leptospira inadai serovar Lyme]